MTLLKSILIIFALTPLQLVAQADTIIPTEDISNTNISCFYVIDKIWTDKMSSYKRDANGIMNFVQIESGQAVIAARSSRNVFTFTGTVDSLETVLIDDVNTLRIHARSHIQPSTYRGYGFELYQIGEEVMMYCYQKRTLSQYYFLLHTANDAEIAEIRKYILENTPKY